MEEENKEDEVSKNVALNYGLQQGTLASNQNRQYQYAAEEAEKNLAETQLDCDETLLKIYHQLRQDVLTPGEGGVLDWKDLNDPKKRILTDEGVDKIMQVLQSYVNKETLLSNFDEKTIARRMLEFSLALSGILFLKYEIFFRVPNFQECKEILEDRIEEQIKRRKSTLELLGKPVDEKEIKKEVIKEIEPRLDYEIQKIKSEQTKLNLREYEMLFTQLKAIVEATHNRAWKGEERGSLRRHFNISEIIGGKGGGNEKKRNMFGM